MPSFQISSRPAGFALISVLALVSLASLTALAFLSSARLERQATTTLSGSTVLEMALNAGSICAREMLDYAPSKHFNYVTTYWRGTDPNSWTNELGYLLNGAVLYTNLPNRTSTIVNYHCCFSTATFTNLDTVATRTIVVSNGVNSQGTFSSQMASFMQSQINFANGQSTTIPLLGNITSPPVGWVYINQDVRVSPGSTNTTNTPVVRFAFFVQDLGGMIDAERMGGWMDDGSEKNFFRAYTKFPATNIPGTNPAEISLTDLTGTALTSTNTATNFVSSNNRIKYLSPGILTLTQGGRLATNDLRYVTTGLRHWTNAYERVPVGLGYANSWSIKTRLRDVNFTNTNQPTLPPNWTPTAITPTTNTNFIWFITNNLTNFSARAGGMNTNRYIAALGVNVKDYIDADINITINNFGGGAVRGLEPLPFVTETATSVWWYDHGTNLIGISGVGDEFRTVNYVELWNPSDRTFNGDIVVLFSNAFGMGPPSAGGNINGISLNLSTNQPAAGIIVTNTSSNCTANGNSLITVSLAPNEYRVYELGTNIHRFRVGAAEPVLYGNGLFATNGGTLQLSGPPNGSGPITNCKVVLSYAGIPYDQSLINRTSSDGAQTARVYRLRFSSAQPSTTPFYAASYPALRPYVKGVASPALPGDVRMSYYLTITNNTVGYNSTPANPGSSLGYRNRNRSSLGGVVDYNTDYSTWLDGGHTNSPYNNNSVTEADLPPLGAMPFPPATSDYVQKFNNTGTWSNIFELGNIFDPMAWNVDAGSSGVNTANTPAGNGSTTLTNGGGTTLRIGRAEHPRFAWTNLGGSAVPTPNMMMSAAALLDLFCVENQFDEGGHINLNTASAPVLRALAGGIYLRKDAALGVGGIKTNYPIPASMAEAFAQGVMRFRAQYPFYSPSQLAFIGTDPSWPNTGTWPANAVFGNTNGIFLSPAPGNTNGSSAKINISSWNDEAAEEWFSKIYNLSTTYSRNFRVYVVAQRVTNNGGTIRGIGSVARKYYNIITRQNSDAITNQPAASASTFISYQSSY